jgi:hypothetical protein
VVIQLDDALSVILRLDRKSGGAFDTKHCAGEVRFVPTLVLREKIPPAAKASAILPRQIRDARPDRSLEGVLIFSGIGFTLLVLAIAFWCLELPPPYF